MRLVSVMFIAFTLAGCSVANKRCLHREWIEVEETRYFTGGGSAVSKVRKNVCAEWEEIPEDENAFITDIVTDKN